MARIFFSFFFFSGLWLRHSLVSRKMISSAAVTQCVSTVHIYLVEKCHKNTYSSARFWASCKYTACCGLWTWYISQKIKVGQRCCSYLNNTDPYQSFSQTQNAYWERTATAENWNSRRRHKYQIPLFQEHAFIIFIYYTWNSVPESRLGPSPVSV
jgi:hypothetical protein